MVMTRKFIWGTIGLTLIATNGVAFIAGIYCGKQQGWENYSVYMGALEGRVTSAYMQATLTALNRGEGQKVKDFLVTKLIGSSLQVATFLESNPRDYFPDTCKEMLKSDAGFRRNSGIEILSQNDLTEYEHLMNRIKNACERIGAPPK